MELVLDLDKAVDLDMALVLVVDTVGAKARVLVQALDMDHTPFFHY